MRIKSRAELPEMENMKKYHNMLKYYQYFESWYRIDVYTHKEGILGQVQFNDNISELKYVSYDEKVNIPESIGITKLKTGQLILIDITAGTQMAFPITKEKAVEIILQYNKTELLEELDLT